MTEMGAAERRKERRYIVCGMRASIDGRPSQIVDISRSGVRLLLPPGFVRHDGDYDVVFELPEGGDAGRYRVSGSLVRSTDIYVVFTYEPPTVDWEQRLIGLDTFEMTRLSAI